MGKNMAFMVVSKRDQPELEGGEHYSLLVHNKSDHTFSHMDSIKGMNESCAKDLYVNSLTKEMINKDGHLSKFVETNCARQKNNYDCGPLALTIYYIWRMLDYNHNADKTPKKSVWRCGVRRFLIRSVPCLTILYEKS